MLPEVEGKAERSEALVKAFGFGNLKKINQRKKFVPQSSGTFCPIQNMLVLTDEFASSIRSKKS